MTNPEAGQAKIELAVGGGLVATPWWASYLADVHIIAGTTAAVCGAIVGIHAVWRLIRRSRR